MLGVRLNFRQTAGDLAEWDAMEDRCREALILWKGIPTRGPRFAYSLDERANVIPRRLWVVDGNISVENVFKEVVRQ